MQENTGLLEYLSQEVNCNYISDLCQATYLPQIQDAVRYMDPDQYDICQWSDAVSYITKKKVDGETPGQYKEYLLHL